MKTIYIVSLQGGAKNFLYVLTSYALTLMTDFQTISLSESGEHL